MKLLDGLLVCLPTYRLPSRTMPVRSLRITGVFHREGRPSAKASEQVTCFRGVALTEDLSSGMFSLDAFKIEPILTRSITFLTLDIIIKIQYHILTIKIINNKNLSICVESFQPH